MAEISWAFTGIGAGGRAGKRRAGKSCRLEPSRASSSAQEGRERGEKRSQWLVADCVKSRAGRRW